MYMDPRLCWFSLIFSEWNIIIAQLEHIEECNDTVPCCPGSGRHIPTSRTARDRIHYYTQAFPTVCILYRHSILYNCVVDRRRDPTHLPDASRTAWIKLTCCLRRMFLTHCARILGIYWSGHQMLWLRQMIQAEHYINTLWLNHHHHVALLSPKGSAYK